MTHGWRCTGIPGALREWVLGRNGDDERRRRWQRLGDKITG
jgi:hypothetical protein